MHNFLEILPLNMCYGNEREDLFAIETLPDLFRILADFFKPGSHLAPGHRLNRPRQAGLPSSECILTPKCWLSPRTISGETEHRKEERHS